MYAIYNPMLANIASYVQAPKGAYSGHYSSYAAMSIIQGGSNFPFLSIPVYSYIWSCKYTNIAIMVDDIPDPSLKLAVERYLVHVAST